MKSSKGSRKLPVRVLRVLTSYQIDLVAPEKEWTLLPGAFAIPANFYVRMRSRQVKARSCGL